jgi:hypothetical protein
VRHVGTAPPAPLALPADLPQAELLQFQEQAAYTPCFDFADTVATGYVAGLKLGREGIRFEFIAAAEPEAVAEETPLEQTPADEQVLPHQVIAAVMGADAPARLAPPALEQAPAIDVVAEPEPAPLAATAGQRLCEWLPIDLSPVTASTRQRLMQTFQAVGIAPAAPGAPEFAMLPVRPKYVLGRAAAAAAAAEVEGPVAVATAEEIVQPAPAPVPQAAVRVHEPINDPPRVPSLATIPVDGALEFLQDYEKRQQGVFSKLLGRIGLN